MTAPPTYNPFVGVPTVSTPPSAPQDPSLWGPPTNYHDERVSSDYNPARVHPISGRVRPHNGVDITGATGGVIGGSNAMSIGEGVVKSVGHQRGYGNAVEIDHGNGYTSLYGHLDSFADLKPGDKVTQGQTIGIVGNTGGSTGPHMHMEVRQNGKAIDPETMGYRTTSVPGRDPIRSPGALALGEPQNLLEYSALRAALPTAPLPAQQVAQPAPVPTPRPALPSPTPPTMESAFALAPEQAPTGAAMAADLMAAPETPSIPVMEAPTAPVPTAKPEPMTVTQQDVLDAFNRQNGTPMPGAPVPMSKPSTGAPMPTPNPMALADRTPPTPSPNPMAMADRTPPIPTANPLGQAPQTQMAFAGNNSPSVPTAAPPGGITNEPGFIQGLAPSLVERAKELGLEAPEGQVIGYSPVAPNGLTSVNANAGPSATGPGLFGFSERDFGIGGGGAQGLASYATGMPGRIGGSVLGGAAGTAVGGPIGGILGAMLGGYAGGKITSGLAAQNAASALGQAPVNTGGWLGGLFGGDPSSSSEISQESRDAVSGIGGLW